MKQDERRSIGLESVLEDDLGISDSPGDSSERYLGNPEGTIGPVHQQDCEGFPVLDVVPDGKDQLVDIAGSGDLWPVGSLHLGGVADGDFANLE